MKTILAGSAEHLERNSCNSRVQYISLNLPFRCNYRCTKCASSQRQFRRAHENPLLELGEIKKINESAVKCGAKVLAFMGEGEPLLEPRLPEIISDAASIGLMPLVFTNCSMLEGELAKILSGTGASLVVNIDSMDKGKYEELTGGGSLETVLDNLRKAKELFVGAAGSGLNLARIAVNMVVSRKNIGEIEAVASYCEENGFVFSSNLPIHIGSANKHSEFFLAPDEIEKVRKFSRPFGTDSYGKCRFLKNGITYAMSSELLPCPYALEVEGRYGKINKENILESQEKVLKDVEMFEREFGNQRCLLRHENYNAFAAERY